MIPDVSDVCIYPIEGLRTDLFAKIVVFVAQLWYARVHSVIYF